MMERTEHAYLGRAAKEKSIKKRMYWSFTMVHCHCCSELAYFMKVATELGKNAQASKSQKQGKLAKKATQK